MSCEDGNVTVKVLGSDVYKAVRNFLKNSEDLKEQVNRIVDAEIKDLVTKRIEAEINRVVNNYASGYTVQQTINRLVKEQVGDVVTAVLKQLEKNNGRPN